MKYLVVSLIVFFTTLQTFAQQDYFIYLQTDNNQPFYLRLNNNIYSSSASGYLILSKQPDSNRAVSIGFPKNAYPEQLFTIPVNSRDAGYLLKNFGDKGWGLFNLQTLLLIMNSNATEEKKKPEITGSKKTDAFSLLLANAVNDTAVLYTVAKPKKIVPAPAVAAIPEKKIDSQIPAQQQALDKDTMAVSISRADPPKKIDDSIKAPLPGHSKPDLVTKNSAAVPDSDAIKNVQSPPVAVVTPKTTNEKNSGNAAVKNTNSQKKGSIIMMGEGNPPKEKQPAVVKNNKERKDTIILMPGRVIENDQAVAKKSIARKEKNQAANDLPKDTLQVKKEVLMAPEEKRNALLSNNDAVVIDKIPVKKDTGSNNISAKIDTPAMAKTLTGNATDNKQDSLAHLPARRLRPLVNKAVEVLTDTSYIAIFVDESKEKFDTIRVNIPFDESKMAIEKDKPKSIIKESKPIEDKAGVTISKDNTVDAPVRNTGNTKDSSTISATLPAVPYNTKKDSSMAPADSAKTAATTQQQVQVNQDCKEIATDGDIDKLRIKMLLVASDEDRVAVAKKVFRQKCFLVKQVTALSELYKTDEGKYKWFDAVYPFVSDTGNFSSLADLLKDNYYINRFKAMLRN